MVSFKTKCGAFSATASRRVLCSGQVVLLDAAQLLCWLLCIRFTLLCCAVLCRTVIMLSCANKNLFCKHRPRASLHCYCCIISHQNNLLTWLFLMVMSAMHVDRGVRTHAHYCLSGGLGVTLRTPRCRTGAVQLLCPEPLVRP